MKTTAKTLALALVFFAFGASAFAYELSSPVVVSGGAAVEEGSSQVDFSRSSRIEGRFIVNDLRSRAYITVGNVAAGEQGYGFMVDREVLYLVSNNGVFTHRMPVAIFTEPKEFTIEADFTPGYGITFDTTAVENFSRGILQRFLPGASVFRPSALHANVDNGSGVLTVSDWKYSD